MTEQQRIKTTKQRIIQYVTLVLAVGFLVAIYRIDWDGINHYAIYNSETISYARAKVIRIESEQLDFSDADHCYLGEQELTVRLLEGEQKGETIRVNNYLTRIHNIHARVGGRIIICADMPENATPYYTVFNYDRTSPLIFLIIIFAGAVLLVGRKKGVRALLGVGFTLAIIMRFMLMAIYHGLNPFVVIIITVLLTTGISLILLNGYSRKSFVSFLGTIAGLGITTIIYVVFSGLLHLSGYNTDMAEILLLVKDSTGLSIRHLLLIGVLISALGAIMDVAVSLAAALDELYVVNPHLDKKDLLKSGLTIGKDMIGTMSNTLILAYVGTSFNTMLALSAYGYQMNQLFSSDYLAIQLLQSLGATIGVVLTVPITSAIGAMIYTGKLKTLILNNASVNIK